MEYRAWVIINGALENEIVFDSEKSREVWMEGYEKSLIEENHKNWEIWYADVTDGFGVGELSGEEGCVYAKSDD